MPKEMSDKVELSALIVAGPCKYLTDEKLNFTLPLHTHTNRAMSLQIICPGQTRQSALILNSPK